MGRRARARPRRASTTASSSSRPTSSTRPRSPRSSRRADRRRRRAAAVNLVGGFAEGGRVHETPIDGLRGAVPPRTCARPTSCAPPSLPHMLEAGGGAIVCVSTRAAVRPFPGAAGYIASKAAVLAFVDALVGRVPQRRHPRQRDPADIIDTPGNRAANPDAELRQLGQAGGDRRRHPLPVLRRVVADQRRARARSMAEPDLTRPRGGIDLGGTKIQAIVADADHKVLGEARQPTPTTGGPQDVIAALADAMREAASRRGVERRGARGRRRRLAGRRRREAGHRRAGRQPARLDRAVPARRAARRRRSARPSRSATTSRWRPTRSSSSAPASRTSRCSASSGARASAAASSSTASSGRAAARRARSATWSSSAAAAAARAGGAAAWRPTPGARRWRPRARKRHDEGAHDRRSSRSCRSAGATG